MGEGRLTILFDLDGTLIDSTEAILESFGVAYSTFGTKLPNQDDITALVGFPLDVMFSKLGIADDVVWDYVNEYKKHYRDISKIKTKLLPLGVETIKLAHSFATIGVVTTKTGSYSLELLNHWGVGGYFETVVGRENVINPKPHQEPIEKALQNLNKTKENAWIIGDTILDAQSAKNAGINSVCVTCGYGKKDDLLLHSEVVVSNAYEAVEYIQKIFLKK